MPPRRRAAPAGDRLPPPGQQCPLAPCIRLLAGAWTLEIIYYLRNGAQRFGQLRRSLAGISSKVLTARLRQLEQRGAVRRKVIPANPPMVEYALTPIGLQLLPVLNAMSRVGKNLGGRQ